MTAVYQLPPELQTLVDAARQRRDERLIEEQRQQERHAASLRADFTIRVNAIRDQMSPALVAFAKDQGTHREVLSLGSMSTMLICIPGYLPIHVLLQRRSDGYHVIPAPGRFGPFGLYGIGDSNEAGNRLRWTDDLGEALLIAGAGEVA